MTVARYVPPAEAIPAWATDEDYPAGADPWSASPTKVAPSSGQIADGFVPDTQPPAQWFNWFQHTIQQHLAANSAWYVHNWTPGSFVGGAFPPHGNLPHAACTVMSAVTDGVPVLVMIDTSGTTWRLEHETASELSSAAETDFVSDQPRSLVGGVFGGDVTLLAVQGSGACLQSADLGETWTSAGSVPGGADKVAHYYLAEERWIVACEGAAKTKYSNDLATWSNGAGTGAGATHPDNPRAMADSGTAVVLVFSTSTTLCARSSDGITWTTPALAAGGHAWQDVSYSAVRTAWMAVASDGVGAYSLDDGLAWTEIAIPAGVKAVAAFGRFFVCTFDDGAGKTSIAISEDLGATWSTFVLQRDVDDPVQNYNKLLPWDGRIVAIGSDSLFRRRVACSLRAPWLPTPW
jgi:hypothetical protein